MTLEIGQVAPDFSLRDQHGQDVTLTSYRGEKSVVLIFYPFAFSSVCTGELSGVRDNLAAFVSNDADVLAVSCDPMFSLRAFADAERLRFPLLSDFWPHGAVSTAYGVFDDERGCATRSSYIIDTEGVVRWAVHNAMPDARDLEEHTRRLADLAAR